MAYYLSHINSLRPLLVAHSQGLVRLRLTQDAFDPEPPAGQAWHDTLARLRQLGVRAPVHIQVNDRNQLRRLKTAHVHLSALNQLPESFWKVDKSLYITSANRCFVDEAALRSLYSAIQLGFELCGTYSLDDTAARGFWDVRSSTTQASLAAFAAQCNGSPGAPTAGRAAQFVMNGSASPRETDVAMQLFLPPRLGGFGFPPALLNYPLPGFEGQFSNPYRRPTNLQRVNQQPSNQPRTSQGPSDRRRVNQQPSNQRQANQHLANLRTIPGEPAGYAPRCDFYWPEQRVAVEYDSDAEHTGSDRIHHDSVRRNRLTSGNITVLTYTNDQFKSWQETQQFAIQLASLLKWNVRTSRFETTQHTIDLRKFLFGSEY